MLKAYKYRLYPNNRQMVLFNKTFGSVRFLYNQLLADRINIYQTYKDDEESLKKIKPRSYTSFKEEYPFLKEVSNSALASANMDLFTAYNNFFSNKSFGFPKFKSKKKSSNRFKIYRDRNNIRIENGMLKVPKAGWVKLKQHRLFSGEIRNITISKSPSGKYYVSILVKQEDLIQSPAKNLIGIDLGLTDFAVTTNDEGVSKKYKAPQFLRKSEKELKKAHKALSRKKIGSNNRNKARIALAKKHEKIANQRKDFLHKLSHKITSENQVIVIETLRSENLRKNRKLSKSISDISWFEFSRQLEYKSNWLGRTLKKADQWFPSSQICSECDSNGGKKSLNIREWVCLECGTQHDRDINASMNLLKLVL